MKANDRQQALHAIRFAGIVVGVIVAFIAYFVIVRLAFDFSPWAGILALAGTVVGLYMTANRWIRWLPGLLPFGILNSAIALSRHRMPNGDPVSTGPSSLSLFHYAVAWIVSYWYVRELLENDSEVSPFGRCAFIVFCGSGIWDAWTRISKRADVGFVTPVDVYAVAVGLGAIITALVLQKWHARQPRRHNELTGDVKNHLSG